MWVIAGWVQNLRSETNLSYWLGTCPCAFEPVKHFTLRELNVSFARLLSKPMTHSINYVLVIQYVTFGCWLVINDCRHLKIERNHWKNCVFKIEKPELWNSVLEAYMKNERIFFGLLKVSAHSILTLFSHHQHHHYHYFYFSYLLLPIIINLSLSLIYFYHYCCKSFLLLLLWFFLWKQSRSKCRLIKIFFCWTIQLFEK